MLVDSLREYVAAVWSIAVGEGAAVGAPVGLAGAGATCGNLESDEKVKDNTHIYVIGYFFDISHYPYSFSARESLALHMRLVR